MSRFPPFIDDAGSFGAEIPQPGKAGAFHKASHDLPNGLRIRLCGVEFLVDEGDWLTHKHKPWRAYISRLGRLVVVRQIGSRSTRVRNIYLQHEILGAPNGVWIDHINGDAADNRRGNLRVCTPTQNAWNRRPKSNSTVVYKGVSKKKNRFVARIKDGPKLRTIGSYLTPELAALAYDRAAFEAFGEFAWINSSHFSELIANKE